MQCEVIKRFSGFHQGQIVDSSSWRWENKLIEQRYIRPVQVQTAVEVVPGTVTIKKKRGRPKKHDTRIEN